MFFDVGFFNGLFAILGARYYRYNPPRIYWQGGTITRHHVFSNPSFAPCGGNFFNLGKEGTCEKHPFKHYKGPQKGKDYFASLRGGISFF